MRSHSLRFALLVNGSIALCLPLLVAVLPLGCKDLTGNQPLPSGTQDPSNYSTAAGAFGMRNAAVKQFENALHGYVLDAGLLTDEFTVIVQQFEGGDKFQGFGASGSLDGRFLPEQNLDNGGIGPADPDFSALNQARGLANQAIGAVAAYDTGAFRQGDPAVLRGELYALEGYAEILLADLFCSGVPLSTVDFQHDFTYHASSTTTQVYQDAIAKFDSASTLASANDTILNLVRLGKGRALLDLGQYAEAAQTVAIVPDSFRYQLAVKWTPSLFGPGGTSFSAAFPVQEADREGRNGLPFLFGGDPRTVDTVFNDGSGLTILFPYKYSTALSGSSGYAPVTVADGIEARLIQAEAALQVHDTTTWLTLLNHLRETAMVSGQTTTLPDTTDPGTDTARLSLTFRERAYWLFATGHRQGDLRRLVRNYHRSQNQVYPTGAYLGFGTFLYGSDVNAPIPASEAANPLFHGCLDRNA